MLLFPFLFPVVIILLLSDFPFPFTAGFSTWLLTKRLAGSEHRVVEEEEVKLFDGRAGDGRRRRERGRLGGEEEGGST